ncbi:MAG: hypothetical protein FJ100_02700 [Deltaproteobacteria bacterium]|nr:hypothetical protein [Deltaproteobacteria bacterium]
MGRNAASQGALAGWVLAVWAVAVALPFAALWPDQGLDRPVVRALLAAGPAAVLWGALFATPWHTLAAGLIASALPLVSSPALWGPPAARPWAGVLLAALVLGALDAATAHAAPPGLLRQLLRRVAPGRDRWLAALGVAWLVLAWMGADLATGDAAVEWQRSARVATAALGWSLVAGVRMAASQGAVQAESLHALALRRLAWVALFGGLLWLWRAGG